MIPTCDQVLESAGLETVTSTINRVQEIIESAFGSGEEIEVLEAGCGSSIHFDLGVNAHISGIDISETQLRRNDRIHVKICGNLESYPLPSSQFHLVICWYVLEHLRRPERALVNLTRSLREDGLLILALPSVCSVKGLITKFMPHWFHLFVYRRLLGRPDAGKNDRGPFRTFLRWSIRPTAMKRFAERNNLTVDYVRFFEDYTQHELRTRYGIINVFYKLLDLLTRALTLARFNIYLTDYVIVLKKTNHNTVGCRSFTSANHMLTNL